MKERLKAWRRSFRAWQLKPMRYRNGQKTTTRCANCDMIFADNYCPRCGQHAGVGRVGWHTVRQNIMLLWGIESNSMLYTLLQLLGRPGYLIHDYINGKQKANFPPVKMLFIIALVLVLLKNLFPDAPEEAAVAPEDNLMLVEILSGKFKDNPGLSLMILNVFFLLPTWLLFRHAPRNNRHTLPQGFFIQVFMSVLIIFFDCLGQIFGDSVEMFMLVYYIIAFRQLFGYRLWGTLWRLIVCFLQTFLLLIIVAVFVDVVIKGRSAVNKSMKEVMLGLLIFSAFNILLLVICYQIGRYTEKKRKKRITADAGS